MGDGPPVVAVSGAGGAAGSSTSGGSLISAGTGYGGDAGPFNPPLPFEALGPDAGAAKVKKVMTGLPLTESERAAVVADPAALAGLVDTWMQQPEWRSRLQFFFQQAFQQTQTAVEDYTDQIYHGVQTVWTDKQRLVANAEESFARTALGLIDEGRPFTEVLTTHRFMMTTGLLHTIAYIDAMPRGDAGQDAGNDSWFLDKHPGYTFRGYTKATALFAEGSFMHGGNLFGAPKDVKTMFSESDWGDWRWVTFREPASLAETTEFNDLPALRSATEAVLYGPRVGFFTSPAFFANWPNNIDNGSRVLANQTLIVALDRSIDEESAIFRLKDDGSVEQQHATPGTVCYACHVTLDPMRDFFRLSFGYYGHPRSTPPPTQNPFPMHGTFSVDGSKLVQGTRLDDLGAALASHPDFGKAWTQKLCRFANSENCADSDPEFLRVAAAFEASGFDFPTLVKTLMSSPLVTYTERTKSAEDFGVVVSIARAATLCMTLAARTGIEDPCDLAKRSAIGNKQARQRASNLALAVPGDGYARGEEKPLLPRDPNLFFFKALEGLCAVLAEELVDGTQRSRYASSALEPALHELVASLVGVPEGDPSFDDWVEMLRDHHRAALQEKDVTPTAALRSTFVVACQAPLTISLGL